MTTVAAIGECMVELSSANQGLYSLAHGGDTFNTAVYLSRLGVDTDYVSALGDDPLSDMILEGCRSEKVGTRFVARVPGRMPGLYMIRRDAAGERTFLYWRDRAPAREVFDNPEPAFLAALETADWLYFSGITLSLYPAAGRERLHALLKSARARGNKVAFDGNYRPRGWADAGAARAAFAAILPLLDVALPTLEDEQALFGDVDAEACANRLLAAGVGEVVVKQGPSGCLVATPAERVFVPSLPGIKPIDTTAAGDSFNAGYLAARFRGASLTAAAEAGHRLAATVICHVGAIIPVSAMPAA